jgi:hypothetical protein
MMGSIFRNYGVLISAVFIAILVAWGAPYILDQRCKGRWAPLHAEASWQFETGCMVKIQGMLFKEENVQVGPAPKVDLSKTN